MGRGKYFEELTDTVPSSLVEDTYPQFVNSYISTLGFSSLMLSSHIAASINNAFYHLHLTRRLHPTLMDGDVDSVIHAFLISQLDYSKAIT